MKYRLARHFSKDQWPTTFNTFKAFGTDGYVFKLAITTTAKDGNNSSSGIFLHIDHSKSHYQYSLNVLLWTSASILRQLNGHGAAGYRLKSVALDPTALCNIYVRDQSHQSAKCIYRCKRCVSNLAELFAQADRYGAQGYRQFQSFFYRVSV